MLLCLLLLHVMLLPAAASTPDFTLYHTAEQLLSQAAAIKEHNPDYISTTSCPAIPDLPIYTITSQHTHSHIGTPKLRLLLNFGEHGRELITSEIALTLLRFLDTRSRQLERQQKEQTAQQRDAEVDGGDAYEYERYVHETDNDVSDAYLAFLLHNTHTTVVPLLNVWGRQRVEAGEACSRKNRNGVDLNRNYDFMHAQNTAPAHDETYAGSAPFTEPESQCIAQLASPPNVAPTVYANVHSGIQELYFGWDWTATPPLPNQREVTRLYEHVNSYHCSCKVGAAGKIAGYVVHGGSMDWMYAQRNVSYSLTFEVYGDDRAAMGDCYRTFNPQTREALQDTCYRFATSFFSVMQYLVEEKFGVVFPYRPPAFTLVPLYMTEDKKTRDAVKVYYHTWKQLTQRFSVWTGDNHDANRPDADSHIRLPAFDPHNLLAEPPVHSATRFGSPLRVLFIAQNQSNAFFPTELLYHLSHQHATQPYATQLHLVILPSLFPVSRQLDELCSAGVTAERRVAMASELYVRCAMWRAGRRSFIIAAAPNARASSRAALSYCPTALLVLPMIPVPLWSYAAQSEQYIFFSSASWLRWCTRKQLLQVNSSACLGSTRTVSSSAERSAPGRSSSASKGSASSPRSAAASARLAFSASRLCSWSSSPSTERGVS